MCNSCVMRGDALGRLSQLAAVQWGLFTARQATQEEVSRWDLSRLATDGAIEIIGYGVYRVSGAPRTAQMDLKVAWLQLEPSEVAEDRDPRSGVVSHTSAATLYEVGDFEPDIFEFTRPTRFRSRRDDVIVHVASLDVSDVQRVDQLLVTNPTRLARDLLAQHHDGGHVGQVFADMIVAGLVTRRELATASRPYALVYGLRDGDGPGLVSRLIGHVAGRPAATTHQRRAA